MLITIPIGTIKIISEYIVSKNAGNNCGTFTKTATLLAAFASNLLSANSLMIPIM